MPYTKHKIARINPCGSSYYGVPKKFYLRGFISELSEYIFLGTTYFCSSYIIEEEIINLKQLYLCYHVVLLREVTIHLQNWLWNLVFLRIKKRSSLCGFDWEENSEKGLGQWKRVSMSLKCNLCICVWERKKLQLWNYCNYFKVYKKYKSPNQKGFLNCGIYYQNILFSLL